MADSITAGSAKAAGAPAWLRVKSGVKAAAKEAERSQGASDATSLRSLPSWLRVKSSVKAGNKETERGA